MSKSEELWAAAEHHVQSQYNANKEVHVVRVTMAAGDDMVVIDCETCAWWDEQ